MKILVAGGAVFSSIFQAVVRGVACLVIPLVGRIFRASCPRGMGVIRLQGRRRLRSKRLVTSNQVSRVKGVVSDTRTYERLCGRCDL